MNQDRQNNIAQRIFAPLALELQSISNGTMSRFEAETIKLSECCCDTKSLVHIVGTPEEIERIRELIPLLMRKDSPVYFPSADASWQDTLDEQAEAMKFYNPGPDNAYALVSDPDCNGMQVITQVAHATAIKPYLDLIKPDTGTDDNDV